VSGRVSGYGVRFARVDSRYLIESDATILGRIHGSCWRGTLLKEDVKQWDRKFYVTDEVNRKRGSSQHGTVASVSSYCSKYAPRERLKGDFLGGSKINKSQTMSKTMYAYTVLVNYTHDFPCTFIQARRKVQS
jgi:hypothetical protein